MLFQTGLMDREPIVAPSRQMSIKRNPGQRLHCKYFCLACSNTLVLHPWWVESGALGVWKIVKVQCSVSPGAEAGKSQGPASTHVIPHIQYMRLYIQLFHGFLIHQVI